MIIGVALSGAQVVEVLAPGGTVDLGVFGRLLDRSGIDFVVLQSDSAPHFDASIAATILGRHTTSVGLVVAAAPLRDHPYNLARRLGSLDHLTGGRAGWLVLPEDVAAPDGSVWTAACHADVLVDAVQIARKLWHSWPSDTIVADHRSGIFADSERIVHIDHSGAHRVAGPLNLPEPPQSHLPVFWDSAHQPDTHPVARVADVVVGTKVAHAAQQLILSWRVGTGEPPDAADGLLIHGAGPATDVISIAAAYVDRDSSRPLAATLRERLGLRAPSRTLSDHPRSAFPLK